VTEDAAGDDVKERLFEDILAANQRRTLTSARSCARADECRDLSGNPAPDVRSHYDNFAGLI
jgi:hypothetical protein